MFFINRRLSCPPRCPAPYSVSTVHSVVVENEMIYLIRQSRGCDCVCDGFNDGDGDCQVGRLSPACHRIRIRHRRRVFMALLVLVMKWWQR